MAAISLSDYEEEDLTDDEIDPCATTIECEVCGEFVSFEEDVVLLQVACPSISEHHHIQFHAFLDDASEPVYSPVHLHMSCYEMLAEELASIIQDVPPFEEYGQPFHCDYCRSTLRMGELLIGVDVGEVALSRRRQLPTFVPAIGNETMVMCLACAVRLAMDETGIEIWEGLGQAEECPVCTIDRCWRRGVGGCRCDCHQGKVWNR